MLLRLCRRPPPSDTRHRQGKRAEDDALRLLRAHGLRLVARNVRNRHGELDLVMRDGALLVVVEVRWRASLAFGGAAGSITPAKQSRLARTALYWQTQARLHGQALRFDVVAFERGRPLWLRAAFEPDIPSQPLRRRRGPRRPSQAAP
ncbi:hypothetical protein D554_1283 [Bordetella holmesii 30539]|uniref:UPF0102 protein L497_3472 n=2 Tax=Bordetella holmesii TaxID=35814 RepID=A0A158M7J3_9BORD|nr:hypothetical protein D560_1817 [Bordetella holmesii ATCC 51541]AMD49088.1 hypothetical protein F783_009860 [Bordetella holmesii F627]EWM42181.1 hypothetical protein D556_1822 [Bordetella holmesii 41130]EWM47052.1 hypothetical protein D555_1835 [Bordetella holmesii 35009]EWM51220.1 hypothetical protein D557_1073 [Bordetella holmesii 70147]EXF90075.1 hypothetical protein D554_1283 [Bordetella holmesii 30539]EXX96281.1 hypothetical protein D559_3727 [Bordetella holmesii 1058]KAK80763.1 TIGR0